MYSEQRPQTETGIRIHVHILTVLYTLMCIMLLYENVYHSTFARVC